MDGQNRRSDRRFRILWPLALVALGVALRSLRLEWQPLWWDEGYTVFFATEPLAAMARLTAQDIHPPLYYALLHGWLRAFGNAAPVTLRAFSVLVGVLSLLALWRLARLLFPGNARAAVVASLLFAVSPMHIFYSQEVRMYGLELLFGILSTGFFWRVVQASRPTPHTPRIAALGYFVTTTALLYTEYYGAWLPLAHFVWAVWLFRRRLRRLQFLVWLDVAVGAAFLPWLLYAVPQLIPYVSQKVVEDADRPLRFVEYVGRHLLAFTAGHVPALEQWVRGAQWLGVGALGLLVIVALASWRLGAGQSFGGGPLRRRTPPGREATSPASLLTTTVLMALAAGYFVNRRLPFFPEGGERVLLFVLPYVLLLTAWALERTWQSALRASASVALAGLCLAAAAGVWAFYTVPRYTSEDYRPLIRQTVQQGRDADTVFAVFPWQVGYWRAYAPVWGRGERHGPFPVLSPSPAWNVDVAATLDAALAQGKLWFPEHLSLGGILESRIETHLKEQAGALEAVNFDNRWYSPSTRLSAWAAAVPATPASDAIAYDYGAVRLLAGSVAPGRIASANQVLTVRLRWQITERRTSPLRVSLRLLDDEGRVWSIRDYALGAWASDPASPFDETVGLLAPAGLPPGVYRVGVGVGPMDTQTLFPVTGDGSQDAAVALIDRVQVVSPAEPLPPFRLPIRFALDPAVERQGVAFLGSSGYDPEQPSLAGTRLEVNLFLQSRRAELQAANLYISLLDDAGQGAAGWEGWPLPSYPMEAWHTGALVRAPVSFFLPAALSPGTYRLIAGLIDAESGAKSTPVELGNVGIRQRPHVFAAPAPVYRMEPPVQFGSHARLIGYDLARASDGVSMDLTLYWEVVQTLLPPHQVFVQLTTADGTILAQDDGTPGERGRVAPSGTWLPGEYIVDPHQITAPAPETVGTEIRVGLYRPGDGQRLPVTGGASVLPDAAIIPLPGP